jgi:hypothetical protein
MPAKLGIAAALVLALAPAAGAAPPVTTHLTCASCHRQEAQTQSHTPMGIGVEMPPDQTVLRAHPKLTFSHNGFNYLVEYLQDQGQGRYTVSDGQNSLTLPIRYAFGVSMQTYVLEHEGRLYESLASYYPSVRGLAITMGSERLRPHNLVEAMGRPLTNDEVASCFGCHGSGAGQQDQLHLESFRPGLDCEHCHTGAGAHLEAVEQGRTAPVPPKLGQLSAEEMSQFCGNCHRTWETVVRHRWWGELNVRFQPYRLANSQCFVGDDRRIACTSCHNPHQDLARDSAAYDARCLACHSAAPAQLTQVTQAKQWKACPVSKTNCVTCHMPKLELPGGHSAFTDHDIRIVHRGEPYPN